MWNHTAEGAELIFTVNIRLAVNALKITHWTAYVAI